MDVTISPNCPPDKIVLINRAVLEALPDLNPGDLT